MPHTSFRRVQRWTWQDWTFHPGQVQPTLQSTRFWKLVWTPSVAGTEEGPCYYSMGIKRKKKRTWLLKPTQKKSSVTWHYSQQYYFSQRIWIAVRKRRFHLYSSLANFIEKGHSQTLKRHQEILSKIKFERQLSLDQFTYSGEQC